VSPRSRAATGVRSRAASILERALRSKSPVGGLLESARASLGARDRRLLDQLVLGSLRWLRRLDVAIEQAAGRPIRKIDSELLPPLRVAVHQLLFLDRVPAYAAVDAAVADIKDRSHRGAAGFANAILRRVADRRDPSDWLADWLAAGRDSEDPLERLAIETSYPTFLVRRWVERFGEAEARSALEAGNRRRGFQLLCWGDRREIATELRADSVQTRELPLCPQGLEVTSGDPRVTEPFRQGRFYIQDQASQAAARVPYPVPGERVLDLAAAPGGKSFSLLAAEPSLQLVAADASLVRLLRMRANQRRLGLAGGLAVARAEALSFRADFDRIIADLPCSGTGTIARHPELKWRVSESELVRLSTQGLEVLLAVADAVRSGGRMCVVTCSVETEENEDVIASFLERRRDFHLEELALPPQLDPFVEAPGRFRLLPAEDRDGFTVHVLSRG